MRTLQRYSIVCSSTWPLLSSTLLKVTSQVPEIVTNIFIGYCYYFSIHSMLARDLLSHSMAKIGRTPEQRRRKGGGEEKMRKSVTWRHLPAEAFSPFVCSVVGQPPLSRPWAPPTTTTTPGPTAWVCLAWPGKCSSPTTSSILALAHTELCPFPRARAIPTAAAAKGERTSDGRIERRKRRAEAASEAKKKEVSVLCV